MQATLFLISQAYVSGKQLAHLRRSLVAHTEGRAELVRIEREGESLWAALDRLASEGMQEITLRPLGLPSAESLLRWLPGAAGDWLSRQGASAPSLWITEDLSGHGPVLESVAKSTPPRMPIRPAVNGALGKGWDEPPRHRHHILVCTGPRCHLRDAPDLLGLIKAEISRAGLAKECLVASTGCLFPCNAGPVVIHYPHGHWYRLPDAEAVRAFVSSALVEGTPLFRYLTFQTGVTHYAL